MNQEPIPNSALMDALLKALFKVTSRRTSIKFADEAIGAVLQTLEKKYAFLKYIHKQTAKVSDDSFGISISPELDTVDPQNLGKALEALIRIVYSDLDDEGGLYFISELREYVGDALMQSHIGKYVDLDQLQTEQHSAYRLRERKKGGGTSGDDVSIKKGEHFNPLGYTWENVGSWKHEQGTPYCVLYSKEGKELDRLNLDRIIQDYVERLSGYSGVSESEIPDKDVQLIEKEYELLELMYSRDMDAETAAQLLHISPEQLNAIIKKLMQIELIHYSAHNEVSLTDQGISYLKKEEKEKKTD